MAGNGTKRNILILAALLGLVTSYLIVTFLRDVQAKNQQEIVAAVIATQDIPPRTIIEPSMVEMRQVPKSEVPRDALARDTDLFGKVALVNLPQNSIIGAGAVAEKSVTLGLSYTIPLSMRAVTVGVSPVIGVAGFPQPGDHVDVVATFDDRSHAVAKTVLQNVQVLAYGTRVENEQRMSKDGKKPEVANRDTATLLVTPAEAEELVLAENKGKLRLVLRAAGDEAMVVTRGATMRTGAEPAKVAVKTAPKPAPTRRPPANTSSVTNPFYPSVRPESPASATVTVQKADTSPVIEVIRGTEVETVKVSGPKHKEVPKELPSL